MNRLIALIDCDNFFVSCERVFRPDLEGKPVVVLSSNDGCAVSRSREVKALGIPMGAPAFKYKQIFKDNNVVSFSANFELYGDISRRIIQTLTSLIPKIEVYSVDEAFLDITGLIVDDYEAWARSIRKKILKEIGMPVSIGIASTKTLAKIAVHVAKQNLELGGVLFFNGLSEAGKDIILESIKTRDVWGVGWRLRPRLAINGITDALELKKADPRLMQAQFGIHGKRLVYELNGQSCFEVLNSEEPRKSIMSSRTFGEDTSKFEVVESSIASLCAKACRTLRKEGLLATRISALIYTSRFKPNYTKTEIALDLDYPSLDEGEISKQLTDQFRKSYRPDMEYHKALVMLNNLISINNVQSVMFDDNKDRSRVLNKLGSVDRINSKYGQNTIKYAAEYLSESWKPKKRLKSPSYTTNWNELPIVKC